MGIAVISFGIVGGILVIAATIGIIRWVITGAIVNAHLKIEKLKKAGNS